MAYSSSDVQEFVSTTNLGNNNELRVSTIKPQGSDELKSIDIRQWFLADNKEMRAGKGIRIKSEYLADVISALLMNCGYETIIDIEANTGISIELPDSDTSNTSKEED